MNEKLFWKTWKKVFLIKQTSEGKLQFFYIFPFSPFFFKFSMSRNILKVLLGCKVWSYYIKHINKTDIESIKKALKQTGQKFRDENGLDKSMYLATSHKYDSLLFRQILTPGDFLFSVLSRLFWQKGGGVFRNARMYDVWKFSRHFSFRILWIFFSFLL